MSRQHLKQVKRIIVKIGTNTLTNKKGNVDRAYIKNISKKICNLVENDIEVVIVSSGAIGSGKKELGITKKIRDVKLRQAAAAVGQSILMDDYHNAFKKCGKKVAQILVTYNTFFDRKTYLNLRNTLNTLLKMKIVPILNENDPIAIDEIGESFGDNDKMSALVASKIDADLLIMLSDIDGLYNKDPKKNKGAVIIKTVEKIDKKIESYGGRAGSMVGKGGMKSKIEAAKTAVDAGCSVVIVNGREKDIINKVIMGKEVGTIFLPKTRIESKKRWIREAPVKGCIVVDNGAKNAIKKGKNLLPAGVLGVNGVFRVDDIVDISCNGKIFAKAVSDYTSHDLNKIKGKKSENIKKILKCNHINVFRHENLVIL